MEKIWVVESGELGDEHRSMRYFASRESAVKFFYECLHDNVLFESCKMFDSERDGSISANSELSNEFMDLYSINVTP